MFISVLNVLRSFEEHLLQVIAGTNREIFENPKAHSQEEQYLKCTIEGATSSPKYATSGTTSVSESHVNSMVRFPFPPPSFRSPRLKSIFGTSHRGPIRMVPGEGIEPSQGFWTLRSFKSAGIHYVAITK